MSPTREASERQRKAGYKSWETRRARLAEKAKEAKQAASEVVQEADALETKKQERLMANGEIRGPGPPAKKRGTKMKRGVALQVMIYPRPKTKVVLVEASRKAKQKLSSFIQLSALRDIARSRNCNIEDLIPKADLDVLMSQRA